MTRSQSSLRDERGGRRHGRYGRSGARCKHGAEFGSRGRSTYSWIIIDLLFCHKNQFYNVVSGSPGF